MQGHQAHARLDATSERSKVEFVDGGVAGVRHRKSAEVASDYTPRKWKP